ncbi:hypothetical protein [Tenacibaculum soleae]|uniref:hypothetical protein n=1 Tax=Tenacibaculum soleae TaxID=447689 RepID=UPI0022FFDE20|nr:hypothetical protein [Tenacibaculum soleae]
MSNKITIKQRFENPDKPVIEVNFGAEFRTVNSLLFNSVLVDDPTKTLRFEGLKLRKKE